MFDKTLRYLKKLEKMSQIQIPVDDDDDGYLDRECPSEQCEFHFKIFSEDWTEKVRGRDVFCPSCGHSADSEKWWTQQQVEYVKTAAIAELQTGLNDALKADAVRFNRRQPRNSFLSLSLDVKSPPRRVPLPPAAAKTMRQRITCSACGCRYAVIGAAYFCPACGHNSAERDFEQTLAGIKNRLKTLDQVREISGDRDSSEQIIRALIEYGLQEVVSAFQRVVETLYLRFTSPPKARRGAFQNLSEGSVLWEQVTGRSYDTYLGTDALHFLQKMFQQRHLLAHMQGMVDEAYITKSGDQNYRIGQRIVVRAEDVIETIKLVEKLLAGMRQTPDLQL